MRDIGNPMGVHFAYSTNARMSEDEQSTLGRVLVVEPNREFQGVLRERLTCDGYRVVTCGNGREALPLFESGSEAVVLSSAVSDPTALTVLDQFRAIDPIPPILLLSSSGEDAVRALKAGAWAVVRPPLSADEVSLLVTRALGGLLRQTGCAATARSVEPAYADLVGNSPAILQIRKTVQRLAPSDDTPVLICGESGVGKLTLARMIHSASRPLGAFVRFVSSGGSEARLESELLGVEASAASDGIARAGVLELADGGTLFLSELTDMSPKIQGILLSFLAERRFRRVGGHTDHWSDVRVIAVTRRAPEVEVELGALRPELFYRIAAIRFHIPPLRERLDDLPLLVNQQLALLSDAGRCRRTGVTDRALQRLRNHGWMGNIRELQNVVMTAVLASGDSPVDVEHLGDFARIGSTPGNGELGYRLPSDGIDFRKLEREMLEQALQQTGGNQTRAAALLGLSRDQIRYRMAKFGMLRREETTRPSWLPMRVNTPLSSSGRKS